MLDGILKGAGDILGKFIPDANERLKAEGELNRLAAENAAGQLAVNAEEAKHKSIFVSGWRPFIGWSCGIVLVGIPLMDFLFKLTMGIVGLFAPEQAAAAIKVYVSVPRPPAGELWPLLMGILGLGGARSVEKIKGVASGTLSGAVTEKLRALTGGK